MTRLHKFSLKKLCFILVTVSFCIAITWRSEARHIFKHEIYSTLTKDTVPKAKNAPPVKDSADTTIINPSDTTIRDSAARQKIDTFSVKISKDTLDAPVDYEAADSAVLLIKENRFLLYGKTKTTYKDVVLNAPKILFDQQTNVLTAYSSADSTGNLTRAQFHQGTEGFQSDTIQFNFKTQKGLTYNTFTRQDQMFVQANLLKKVNSNTTFAKRVIMTTCDYDDPHFGFVGNKAKFVNEKVAVTGPIHPEFEGVPLPIYLPFGIFPLQRGRHSGLLPPQFVDNEQYGIGLEGLGYYHVLNEYLDMTLRGNIYSYGGWSGNLTSTYRKRYRYNGAVNFSVQHTKFNFKGDPDFSVSNTYFLTWSHSVDPKARPGTTFSASVNAGSTKFNQYVATNPYTPFQNNLASSIAYSKQWAGKPYNLTISANENQNSYNHLINLVLPDAGFTVTTIYPFQGKEVIGTPKWYEKIGVGYNGTARSLVSFYDTAKQTISKLMDTLQWGAQHRFPISLSLPPVGPLMIAPFVTYEETWLSHRVRRGWNDTLQRIDTIGVDKGFYEDRHASFGIGINTAVYGTYQFKHSRLIALRHVIRPTFNFSYQPNMSGKYYDIIQVDPSGRKTPVSQLSGNNIFSGYAFGQFGGINFGLDNNIEIKWRSKKDTGINAIKKIRLIDGFGFNSGYNFLTDTMKLQPFSLYFRSTIGKISITANALLDPYQTNKYGSRIDRFVFEGNHFALGTITQGSVAFSTSFQSKPRDPSKSQEKTPTRQITDPALLGDQQRLQDYIRRNPQEFVDFNLPWSISLSYSLYFGRNFQDTVRGFKTTVNSNISFNNSFSLTPKWNFTTNGYFDFNTMQLTMFTMSISRDMHCWQMSINITPIGVTRNFSFTISPKSSILQNLRVNRSRYYYNY